VGSVLAELVRAGTLRREEVVVVTKAGYLQGENMERAVQREAAGDPLPEVVKYADGVWHCMHPEFLADQIARSRDRLELEVLDVLLLHNPEYFLSDAEHRKRGDLEERRAEFDRRMTEAFRFLEGEVAAGRLGCYGVSSNTCTKPADDPEATSLDRMLAAARAAGGDGHAFRVLQLPMNLVESGAARERNCAAGTVLDAARAAGIAVLVNRPLNAIVDESLLRLAEPAFEDPGVTAFEQLPVVERLEDEYRRDVAPHLQAGPGAPPPRDFFRWAQDIRALAPHVRSLEQWDGIESMRIVPRLTAVLHAVDQAVAESPVAPRWLAWRGRYMPALQALLLAQRRVAGLATRERTVALSAAIDPHLFPERRDEVLSRKALHVLVSTPGVTSVLNGMRTPAYVADSTSVLAWPASPDASAAYEAVASLRL
jgi:aryl-alcohol dehydrogenase-like predicted oxidoreductase